MKTLSNLAAMVACALCGALSVAGVAVAAEPLSTATPAPGVWQKRQYSFVFMGFTSTYSCDGLADQLKRLLIVAGARADAQSRPGACASPYGRPDKFARAELTFYTLVPVGAGKAPDGEPGVGIWRPVEFAIRSPWELANGDCELIEQFRDHVLPLLTVRNVDDHTTCVPHQESGSVINLKFESFAAAPGAPMVAPAVMPAPTIFAYPKQGQSREQQAKDRSECNTAAAAQSGFDPAQPAATPDAGTRRATYEGALESCLTARGYSVK
jgi:hypothetical protein